MSENSHPVSFWFDQETQDRLSHLVHTLNMKRSAVVREAIRRMDSDPNMAEIRRLVSELEQAVSRLGT